MIYRLNIKQCLLTNSLTDIPEPSMVAVSVNADIPVDTLDAIMVFSGYVHCRPPVISGLFNNISLLFSKTTSQAVICK